MTNRDTSSGKTVDDFPKMAELLGAMLGILSPLTQEQRVRLVKSVVAFHELPIGRDPRTQRGDHDCV